MKRTVNTFLLVAFVLSLFNAAPTEFDKYENKIAVITFKTEVIDYGTIRQNSDGKRFFTFVNEGDAP
ncbi:hypothetical protein [Winogradskyella sp.]|uniref:hypothetical protein n=1 Tax=Winogradskyella sp. TaxID=1883156 RepID=UPI003F6D2A13